jgi:hypothetical protein
LAPEAASKQNLERLNEVIGQAGRIYGWQKTPPKANGASDAASETRELALKIKDPEVRRQLLELADEFNWKAHRAVFDRRGGEGRASKSTSVLQQ